MTDDTRTQPLKEWNRLARANTENAIVSSMFEATLKASEPIESFSNWLLLATAAVASFLLANAEKLIPLISKTGFTVGGVLLCISCVFGLISRAFALRCRVAVLTGAAVRETFAEHLAKEKKTGVRSTFDKRPGSGLLSMHSITYPIPIRGLALRSPHKTLLHINKLGRIVRPKQYMHGRFSVSFVATKLRRRFRHACTDHLTPHSFFRLPGNSCQTVVQLTGGC